MNKTETQITAVTDYPNAHIHPKPNGKNGKRSQEITLFNATRPLLSHLLPKESKNQKRFAALHPWLIPQTEEEVQKELNHLQQLASSGTIDGIGECGLDFSQKRCNQPHLHPSRQIALLKKQLQIAQACQLPVTLHTVSALPPIYTTLKEMKLTIPILFHQFTGSIEQIEQLLTVCKGYFSFSPTLLKSAKQQGKKSRQKIKACRLCPIKRLLIENEEEEEQPRLAELYAFVANVKDLPTDQLKQQVTTNLINLFE